MIYFGYFGPKSTYKINSWQKKWNLLVVNVRASLSMASLVMGL